MSRFGKESCSSSLLGTGSKSLCKTKCEQKYRSEEADCLMSWKATDQECCTAHKEKSGNKNSFTAVSLTEMGEKDSANWASQKTYCISGESHERACERR